MTRGKMWLTAVLGALTVTTCSAGWARADHVQVQINVDSPRPVPPGAVVSPPPVVVTPAPMVVSPAPVVVTPAPVAPAVVVSTPPATVQSTLQVQDITANRVRAHTIYANTIDADEVRGMIYQTEGLRIGAPSGTISAPDVVASVIYANTITANSVEAAAVYVRDREHSRVRVGQWQPQAP